MNALASMGALNPAGAGILRWLETHPKGIPAMTLYPEVADWIAYRIDECHGTLSTNLLYGGWVREFRGSGTEIDIRVTRKLTTMFVRLRMTRASWLDQLPASDTFEFDTYASPAVAAALRHNYHAAKRR